MAEAFTIDPSVRPKDAREGTDILAVDPDTGAYLGVLRPTTPPVRQLIRDMLVDEAGYEFDSGTPETVRKKAEMIEAFWVAHFLEIADRQQYGEEHAR
jgi:hypothetical protein